MIALTLIAAISVVLTAAASSPELLMEREYYPAGWAEQRAPTWGVPKSFCTEESSTVENSVPVAEPRPLYESTIPIYATTEELGEALKKALITAFAFCPGLRAKSVARIIYREQEKYAIHMLELPQVPVEEILQITESLKAVKCTLDAFLFIRFIPSTTSVRVLFEIWERIELTESSEEDSAPLIEEKVEKLKQEVAEVAQVEEKAWGQSLDSAVYSFFLCDV